MNHELMWIVAGGLAGGFVNGLSGFGLASLLTAGVLIVGSNLIAG